MVILKKPEGNPIPGQPFLIQASQGVGMYMFSIEINGKRSLSVQKGSEITYSIPEDASGEIRIDVSDNKLSVDSLVIPVEHKDQYY